MIPPYLQVTGLRLTRTPTSLYRKREQRNRETGEKTLCEDTFCARAHPGAEKDKKRPGGAGALAPAGRRAARDYIFSGAVIFSMVRPPAMVFFAATQRASRACCSASGSPLTRQAV